MRSFVSRQAVAVFLCAAGLVAVASPSRAQPAPEPGPTLDPSSPLDPIAGFGVDWPDMDAPEAPMHEEAEDMPPVQQQVSESKPATTPTTDVESEQRYSIAIEGLEGEGAQRIRNRFDLLSTLKQGEGKAANTAQIDRRAREDEGLLRDLLRSEGYYGATVATEVGSRDSRIVVALRVDPGPIYHFSDISIEGLAAVGDQADKVRQAFGVGQGDPVNAEAVLAATGNLRKALGDHGFPFAKVEEPAVTIDHADRAARLVLNAQPGVFARFGDIEIQGKAPFGTKHVRRIARFKRGDVYNTADVEDLRRALIATGLVSSVTLTPVATDEPGVVNLAVALENAPRRTIAGEVGYGTGEGFRAAVSWTHRNLIRPEGEVTFRGVAGTQEQVLGASLRRSNFKKRDQVLTAQAVASHVSRRAYDAKSFTLGAGIERQTNIIWQKNWTWSVGTELVISDERDTVVATGASRRRTFYIAALPGTLAYDGSDDLLNPTRGFRLSGRLSPEVSFHSGSFTYARAQIDASFYQPVTGRSVLAGRIRVGTIAGAKRDQIAPSRRYYAGGGGSVRGYGYQGIGPRDVDDDPIGGRSIAEFALEARIRFGDFGVVPFFDGGNIYTKALPRFTGMRYGAGLGARYYTSFGPIRVDIGTPINRRSGDPRVAVYVSLGQAF
jgi:translocation and assembly module TamA